MSLVWSILSIIASTFCLRMSVHVYKNAWARRLQANLYSVPFFYNHQQYQLLYRIRRKPSQFTRVLGMRQEYEGHEDVSEEIRELMGPNEDFNGVHVTPHQLGFKDLIFFYGDDICGEFQEFDIITFDKQDDIDMNDNNDPNDKQHASVE